MTTDHEHELSAGAQRLLADIDRVVRPEDYDGTQPHCCLLGQVAAEDPSYDEHQWAYRVTVFIATKYAIPRVAAQDIYHEAADSAYAHDLPAAKAMAARILRLAHA